MSTQIYPTPIAGGGSGAAWYDGTGAPSAGLGVDGDYYLDDTTGNVYTKSSGTWNVTASIKGPTGATGPTGPSGTVTSISGLPAPYRNDGTYILGYDPLGNIKWVPDWSCGTLFVLGASLARSWAVGGNFPQVVGAPTADLDNVGTGGNNLTQSGYYVQTSATNGNVACYGAKTGRGAPDFFPFFDCTLRVNTSATISAWWGLQSSGAWTAALADGVVADCILLRYSTTASDTTLKIVTANGTAQTVTDTGVAVSNFTTPGDVYVYIARNVAGTELTYEVWNYPRSTLLASGTINTTLPRTSVNLSPGWQCVARTAGFRWASGTLRVLYFRGTA